MDIRAIREALRRRRVALKWTLDKVAEETGLNRATIHSIENVKREPDLKPELETIERMTNAMGQTLSSFFLQIESLQAPPGSTTVRTPRPLGVNADGTVPHLPAATADLGDFLDLVDTLGAALQATRERIEAKRLAGDRIIHAHPTPETRPTERRRGHGGAPKKTA